MAAALITGYLAGWVVASVVVALLAWRLQDERQPAEHPMLLSVVAGAAWPLLVLGAAQAGAVAVTTEVLHDDEPLLTLVA